VRAHIKVRHDRQLAVFLRTVGRRSAAAAWQIAQPSARVSVTEWTDAANSDQLTIQQKGDLAMANTKKLDIKPTKRDNGLELTITVVAYDNGLITVNKSPIRDANLSHSPWLSASRMMLEILERLADKSKTRDAARAAAARARRARTGFPHTVHDLTTDAER